jgi:hypothetical protein
MAPAPTAEPIRPSISQPDIISKEVSRFRPRLKPAQNRAGQIGLPTPARAVVFFNAGLNKIQILTWNAVRNQV